MLTRSPARRREQRQRSTRRLVVNFQSVVAVDVGLVSKTAKMSILYGIKGNELADKLANAATTKPSIDANIAIELSEAYTLID